MVFIFPIFLILLSSLSINPLHAAPASPQVQTYDELLAAIRETRHASEKRIEAAVEQEKVREAWETGKLIQEHILLNQERANYGEQVIVKLAGDLESNETDLRFMVQFARAYPIRWPATELSWSHYQSLLALNDDKEREEVAKEAVKQKWTRDQVRDEVRRRQKKSAPQIKLSEVKPGLPGVYRVVLATAGPYKGNLVLALGFNNFMSMKGIVNDKSSGGKKGSRGVTASFLDSIKVGDLVLVTTKEHGKSAMYHFQKVYPEAMKYELRMNAPKACPEGVIPVKDEGCALYGGEELLHTYNAWVTSVVDGDTFHCIIDLGFGMVTEQRVRLRQLDAPELVSADGKLAKAALEKALGASVLSSSDSSTLSFPQDVKRESILIKVHDIDQNGRPLVDFWVKNKSIDKKLIESGIFTIREGE